MGVVINNIYGNAVAPAGSATAANQTAQIALETTLNSTVSTATNQNTEIARLTSILAKIIAAPATEAKQDTGNTSLATIAGKDFATQTTLADILAKIIAAPATEATLVAIQHLITTLNGLVSTAAKQDTGNTSLAAINTFMATAAKQDQQTAILGTISSDVASKVKQDDQTTLLSSIDTDMAFVSAALYSTSTGTDAADLLQALLSFLDQSQTNNFYDSIDTKSIYDQLKSITAQTSSLPESFTAGLGTLSAQVTAGTPAALVTAEQAFLQSIPGQKIISMRTVSYLTVGVNTFTTFFAYNP